MIILASICAFLLGFLNELTQPTIKENQEIEEMSAILESVGLRPPVDEVQTLYDEHMHRKDIGEYTVYEYSNGSEPEGYVVGYSGGALWGTVTGYFGISEDLTTLLGLSVTDNNETPGLGGRITEQWYKEQFEGLTIQEKGEFIIYRPNGGANLDAVTGATLTSNSMKNILEEQIQSFIQTAKGGK